MNLRHISPFLSLFCLTLGKANLSFSQMCTDVLVVGYGPGYDASFSNKRVGFKDNDSTINWGAVEVPFGNRTCSDRAE